MYPSPNRRERRTRHRHSSGRGLVSDASRTRLRDDNRALVPNDDLEGSRISLQGPKDHTRGRRRLLLDDGGTRQYDDEFPQGPHKDLEDPRSIQHCSRHPRRRHRRPRDSFQPPEIDRYRPHYLDANTSQRCNPAHLPESQEERRRRLAVDSRPRPEREDDPRDFPIPMGHGGGVLSSPDPFTPENNPNLTPLGQHRGFLTQRDCNNPITPQEFSGFESWSTTIADTSFQEREWDIYDDDGYEFPKDRVEEYDDESFDQVEGFDDWE